MTNSIREYDSTLLYPFSGYTEPAKIALQGRFPVQIWDKILTEFFRKNINDLIIIENNLTASYAVSLSCKYFYVFTRHHSLTLRVHDYIRRLAETSLESTVRLKETAINSGTEFTASCTRKAIYLIGNKQLGYKISSSSHAITAFVISSHCCQGRVVELSCGSIVVVSKQEKTYNIVRFDEDLKESYRGFWTAQDNYSCYFHKDSLYFSNGKKSLYYTLALKGLTQFGKCFPKKSNSIPFDAITINSYGYAHQTYGEREKNQKWQTKAGETPWRMFYLQETLWSAYQLSHEPQLYLTIKIVRPIPAHLLYAQIKVHKHQPYLLLVLKKAATLQVAYLALTQKNLKTLDHSPNLNNSSTENCFTAAQSDAKSSEDSISDTESEENPYWKAYLEEQKNENNKKSLSLDHETVNTNPSEEKTPTYLPPVNCDTLRLSQSTEDSLDEVNASSGSDDLPDILFSKKEPEPVTKIVSFTLNLATPEWIVVPAAKQGWECAPKGIISTALPFGDQGFEMMEHPVLFWDSELHETFPDDSEMVLSNTSSFALIRSHRGVFSALWEFSSFSLLFQVQDRGSITVCFHAAHQGKAYQLVLKLPFSTKKSLENYRPTTPIIEELPDAMNCFNDNVLTIEDLGNDPVPIPPNFPASNGRAAQTPVALHPFSRPSLTLEIVQRRVSDKQQETSWLGQVWKWLCTQTSILSPVDPIKRLDAEKIIWHFKQQMKQLPQRRHFSRYKPRPLKKSRL